MTLISNEYRPPMFPHQEYEDRVVAFVDVLGFKDLVMQSQTDERVLLNITSALSSLYNWVWRWEADGGNSSIPFITMRTKEDYIEALRDIVKKGLPNLDPKVREKYEWLERKMQGLEGYDYSQRFI